MSEFIVQAHGLRKTYRGVDAVRGIDFHIHAGEIVGFIGHNGAGKSTTVRMIAGLSRRSGGHLRVLGADPNVAGPFIRSRTGYLAQRNVLDTELDVRDNLEVHAGYYGMRRGRARRRAEELLSFTGLSGHARARVNSLSGGMARRLAIGRTLVNEPDLLLLDEPASGLDPQARQAVWALLDRLRQRGVAQLLTTHHMDEAHALCDRIVALAEGRVVAQGTPAELIARHCGTHVLELRFKAGEAATAAASLARCSHDLHTVGDHVLIPTDDTDSALAAIRRCEAPAPESIIVRRARLDDVYLALTTPETVR